MKICLISNLYPPNTRGGAEMVVHTLAEAYARLGHEVCVLTLARNKKEAEVTDEAVENGLPIRIYHIWVLNLFFYMDDFQHSWMVRLLWKIIDLICFWSSKSILQILTKEKPDVVHTHSILGLGMPMVRAIRKYTDHWIHTLHGIEYIVSSGSLWWGRERCFEHTSILARIYQWQMKRLLGSPDVVTAPSEWILRFYKDHGFFSKSKFQKVENPLTVQPTALIHRPKSDEASPIKKLVYVGQLEEHKGIRFLLKECVPAFQKDWELHVVGQRSLATYVAAKAKENSKVIYHGPKWGAELLSFLSTCSVLVLPSLIYENAPTIITLAKAVGLPVVASRIGGIPEMIEDGKNGYLFTPGNVEDFCKVVYVACMLIPQPEKMVHSDTHYLSLYSPP